MKNYYVRNLTDASITISDNYQAIVTLGPVGSADDREPVSTIVLARDDFRRLWASGRIAVYADDDYDTRIAVPTSRTLEEALQRGDIASLITESGSSVLDAVEARIRAVGDATYAPQPSGSVIQYGVAVADSSAPNGVRWGTSQEPVARALGWAIVTDPQWAGGAKTDGTNAAPAINSALAGTASCIYIPEGTYTIATSVNITGYHGKRLIGAGRILTKLLVSNAVTTAAILGTSSGITDFTLRDFTIDCDWVSGDTVIPAVQITNGARITIDSVGVKNAGGTGILLQGLNAGGGTPDSTARNCVIDGAGLADGSTGFGVWFKDKSDRGVIEQNRITNVKGGMGIGLGGSAGTGYPTMCRILNNHVQMVSSTIGFEAIGITAGCTNTVIANNVIRDTFDNGISVSADFCTVVGNNVDGTWNHGITAAGKGTQVVGNYIRNVGKENPSLGFGGVCIDTGSWCTVLGNRIVDDQGTPTMWYGVKLNSSGGNNRVGPNSIAGWITAPYLGLISTDLTIDAETHTDGYSFGKLYADTINAKTTNGTISIQSAINPTNFNVVGSGAAKNAQLTVFSNAGSTRANQALSIATGQVAAALKVLNPSDVVLSEITKDGVFKTLAVATGSRPSASTVGAGGMVFDTTLAKPIWSDGTNWKDATGTTV